MEILSIKNRLTIGLAIDNISMVGGQKAFKGIADLVRTQDVNLICYHLDLNSNVENMPEVWDSMGKVVDGLVVFQAWSSEEKFRILKERFPALPMVNAARLYKGCPGVAPDSYGGMKELIRHLILKHGRRKIALILGPEGNWPVEERLRAYKDTLSENGIQFNPKLVTPNLNWWEAQEGLAELIDKRELRPGIDFDAVTGCNDSLALGTIESLRDRGIHVPEDVAVIGFDNNTRSYFSKPPLTTAEYNIGRHAAEILLRMLSGKQVPEQSFAPTKAVLRRSCGCHSAAVLQAAYRGGDIANKGIPLNKLIEIQGNKIVSDMTASAGFEDPETGIPSGWMKCILDDFGNAMAAGTDNKKESGFLNSFENILYQITASGCDLDGCQSAISAMRNYIIPYLDTNMTRKAEDLWQQARVLVEETVRRDQACRIYQAEGRTHTLREIENTLLINLSVSSLMEILKKNLPKLEIESSWMALYEDTGKSRLILAFEKEPAGQTANGKSNLENTVFDSGLLLPDGIPAGRQFSMVLEPLYFQEQQLGFALFETGPLDGAVYDSLRGTISSTLQGALLLDQVQQHARQLDTIINRTMSTSHEIQTAVSATAGQAQTVSDASQRSMDVSRTGRDAVSDTVRGMQTIQIQVDQIAQSISELSKRTRQIEDIIKAVEDIVSQSEVLSINASIQAARAGDRGKGFAVVAREMRNLAIQSNSATSNIRNILAEIQDAAQAAVSATEEGSAGARNGMDLASRAGKAIEDLASTIEEAAGVALQISTSTIQQNNAIEQLVLEVQAIKDTNTGTSVNPQ